MSEIANTFLVFSTFHLLPISPQHSTLMSECELRFPRILLRFPNFPGFLKFPRFFFSPLRILLRYPNFPEFLKFPRFFSHPWEFPPMFFFHFFSRHSVWVRVGVGDGVAALLSPADGGHAWGHGTWGRDGDGGGGGQGWWRWWRPPLLLLLGRRPGGFLLFQLQEDHGPLRLSHPRQVHPQTGDHRRQLPYRWAVVNIIRLQLCVDALS